MAYPPPDKMELISKKKKKALIKVPMADIKVQMKVFVLPLLEGKLKVRWNSENGI